MNRFGCLPWGAGVLLIVACQSLAADDVFVDGMQITLLVQKFGQVEMLRLDEITMNEARYETQGSLDARSTGARRLAALLYFPAVPMYIRRNGLSEGIFDQSDYPCQDALMHLGRSAVVAMSRSIKTRGGGTPEMILSRSSCMADLGTHLEGLVVESRDPVRKARLKRVLESVRDYQKGQKTQLQMEPESYPALYEGISAADFDKGLDPEAKGLSARLHRIGAEMITILKDDKRSNQDRVRAATWLGRTRYVMGIPALLDNIWLADPTASDKQESENDAPKFPCVRALAAFESGASIDLAERIATSMTTEDVRTWKRAILSEDALRGAITHLRGMDVEEQDAVRRAALRRDIQILREDPDSDP